MLISNSFRIAFFNYKFVDSLKYELVDLLVGVSRLKTEEAVKFSFEIGRLFGSLFGN